jgi:hypothetical protein
VIQVAHWRRVRADGRESIAAAGEVVSLSASFQPRPQTWGKITSRRPVDQRELEYQAFRLGCTVSALRESIARGLFNG